MSSGFGWGGGRSRCFVYWQEFQKCYIQTENPVECRPQSSDYLECLHHLNERKRSNAVKAELHRKALHEHDTKKHGHESAPAPTPAKPEETKE